MLMICTITKKYNVKNPHIKLRTCKLNTIDTDFFIFSVLSNTKIGYFMGHTD